MSPEVFAALIGGGSGVISACVTAWLTNRGSSAASKRSESRQAQYLAVQVAPELRAFAAACLRVSYDDGTEEGRPAGTGGLHEPTERVDSFRPDLIQNVDWRTLPAPLMVDVLTFEEKHKAILVLLSDVHEFDDPPDFTDYFSERQQLYVALGAEALELGVRLFRETGHTSPLPGASDLSERLDSRRVALDEERREYEARKAAWQARAVPAPAG